MISTVSGANTAVGIGANSYAATVGSSANSYLLAVIAGANTAVGTGANAYSATVGTSANAFTSATIAGANTAVGTGANTFTSATIAGANTAVGTGANAYSATVGTSANAFTSATIAGANTAVGTGANAFTSATVAGANTISIAAFNKANSALPNTSGVSFVGNLYFPSGNVGIKTSSPAYPLDVTGNINASNTVFAVHFDNVSDISLKENIEPLKNSIDTINNLNPVSFTWKNNKTISYGLIAQEVEKILPSIVHIKEDKIKTVNYIELIAFLLSAIKEQQKQIDDINKRINA
jgi:hypothetical protein